MKSSTIKKIVIKLAADNIFKIDVDADIFDDPYLEAATQAIEQCKIRNRGIIRPIIECWDEKDKLKPKNHHLFNSYWVLVNASLYKKAEILRERFRDQNKMDLSKEPIRGHAKSTL